MTTAVYAGSFDPITNGHLDLIFRAARTFDKLIVGVGVNASKAPLFSTNERITLIQDAVAQELLPGQISVEPFSGLLVDFCHQVEATVIVRGLRAVMDFEAEMGIADANRSMMPELDTHFLPTRPRFSFVSSSTVREIARHPSETGWRALPAYVPPNVLEALRLKFPA
jgi:pantetheine-phosphate adenylyltransferase